MPFDKPHLPGAIAETLHRMIIHHARSLHKRVANCGTHKVEATLLHILTHGIRFSRGCRKPRPHLPRVHKRFAPNELPDVAIEGTKFFLHRKKCFGILYSRSYFQPVADDALIAQQLLRLAPVILRNFLRIETIESGTVVFALAQNRVPTKPPVSETRKAPHHHAAARPIPDRDKGWINHCLPKCSERFWSYLFSSIS